MNIQAYKAWVCIVGCTFADGISQSAILLVDMRFGHFKGINIFKKLNFHFAKFLLGELSLEANIIDDFMYNPELQRKQNTHSFY